MQPFFYIPSKPYKTGHFPYKRIIVARITAMRYISGMAKYISLKELPAFIEKQQGDMSERAFAAKLRISHPTLRAIKAGEVMPQRNTCANINKSITFQPVYRVD